MNNDSEQITLDKNLVIAQDQPLSSRSLLECVQRLLGKEHCEIIQIPKNKLVLKYHFEDKVYHLLVRNCTYLGNPHPIYKKRVQFPSWFNEYARQVSAQDPHVDVRYIGLYHYEDKYHGENIILIDFDKDTYLKKKGHNSSAHVYTNDLFQAMTYGVFTKEDKMGNIITTIRKDHFFAYLTKKVLPKTTLFDLFCKFNDDFPFGQWLTSSEAIRSMHHNGWEQWRQAEWAGFFLEYRFNKFIIDNNLNQRMCYVGNKLKSKGEYDFDIYFEEEKFYGDLKASDESQKSTIANDQQTFIDCIYTFDRLWYVIYEHKTIKDKDKDKEYEATKDRNRYIKSIDSSYKKDEMSYANRMKHSVCFIKMTIIELNRVNFREALVEFNQGRQPDGKSRKPKFSITKEVLDDDNFVVFRYIHKKNGRF